MKKLIVVFAVLMVNMCFANIVVDTSYQQEDGVIKMTISKTQKSLASELFITNNTGIEFSDEEVILLLHHDTVVRDGRISHLSGVFPTVLIGFERTKYTLVESEVEKIGLVIVYDSEFRIVFIMLLYIIPFCFIFLTSILSPKQKTKRLLLFCVTIIISVIIFTLLACGFFWNVWWFGPTILLMMIWVIIYWIINTLVSFVFLQKR